VRNSGFLLFEGKGVLPDTDYKLIYYPDPWPGLGLACLGQNVSSPGGNLQIHGGREILSGLPAACDMNFNPVAPSGAAGAKIWLVPTVDVHCGSGEVDPETGLPVDPSQMVGWNPTSYLFEGNLIHYQFAGEADADGPDTVDGEETNSAEPDAGEEDGNGNGIGKGQDKDKKKE